MFRLRSTIWTLLLSGGALSLPGALREAAGGGALKREARPLRKRGNINGGPAQQQPAARVQAVRATIRAELRGRIVGGINGDQHEARLLAEVTRQGGLNRAHPPDGDGTFQAALGEEKREQAWAPRELVQRKLLFIGCRPLSTARVERIRAGRSFGRSRG